jgi:hypothetical protein
LNVKWDQQNGSYQALLKEIKSNLTLNSDGNVGFKFGIDFSIDALFGKVTHSYSLDYDVLYQLFESSLTHVFKQNKLSKPDEILSEFKKRCDQNLRKNAKYILITSISLNKNCLPKKRSIIVSFSKDIPSKYIKSRANLLAQHSELELSEQNDFVYVLISVQASDIKTAFMNAIGAIDIIRALWQLNFEKKINFLASSKEHEYPTGSVISLGQYHTLHLENGKEAWEGLWYEPEFKKREATTIMNFSLTESNLSILLKKICKNPFNDHIFESLKNYINALDHSNQEFRYMKLWSTIEKMVKSDDSKMIIKRISFFYYDRALHKEILESLRKARNINAHAGVKPFNVEMKNFRICAYIDNLLIFLICNAFKYNTLQQFIDFISLPTDLQTIDEQIKNHTITHNSQLADSMKHFAC